MSGAPVYDGCQIFHPVLLIVLSLLCINCYHCYEWPPELAAQGDSSSHLGATGILAGIKFTNLHTRRMIYQIQPFWRAMRAASTRLAACNLAIASER